MKQKIQEFLSTNPSDAEIEKFYINEVLPVDNRSIEEILEDPTVSDGDILIAKRTQYYRNGSNARFLTRGKEYPIVQVNKIEQRFVIIDDERSPNNFRVSQLDKYFTIKSET